ncbi:MAG TPA: RHS repeat-associated core domain-containing protein [Puia sp.]|nr:RHS repeat-associated core domain-containing protein [Puia sp.]
MNLVAPGGPITLNRSGYLYIWVSNETTGWDVYFDNLSVQYKQGPLLEENHYYPFGLTMAGISDKAIKTNYSENKYRYNSGNELQNKEFSDGSGLELYDAGFRQLDPQLGRFAQIDPLSEMADFSSTYGYANNNPVSMSDPAGLKAQKPPSSLYTYSGLSDQQLADGMMGYLNVSYLESPSNNGPGEGGGMYIGNGMYQLPDGEIVDQQTATDYVTNKYPGSTQSFYGAQAAAVYSYFTGQGNVSTTANNGVQTLNYQYNTTEDGVPVVHDVTATLNGN